MNKNNLIFQYFNEQISKYDSMETSNISFRLLSKSEEKILERKISKLPYSEKSLLYMNYIFPEENILDVKYPRGEKLYLQELLSRSLGLKDEWIDDVSMEIVVKKIFDRENNIYFYNKLKVDGISFIIFSVFLVLHIYFYKNGIYGMPLLSFDIFRHMIADKYVRLELIVILVPAIFHTAFLIKNYLKNEPIFIPYYSWDKGFSVKVLAGSVITLIVTRIFFSDYFSVMVLFAGLIILYQVVSLGVKELMKVRDF